MADSKTDIVRYRNAAASLCYTVLTEDIGIDTAKAKEKIAKRLNITPMRLKNYLNGDEAAKAIVKRAHEAGDME